MGCLLLTIRINLTFLLRIRRIVAGLYEKKKRSSAFGRKIQYSRKTEIFFIFFARKNNYDAPI